MYTFRMYFGIRIHTFLNLYIHNLYKVVRMPKRSYTNKLKKAEKSRDSASKRASIEKAKREALEKMIDRGWRPPNT